MIVLWLLPLALIVWLLVVKDRVRLHWGWTALAIGLLVLPVVSRSLMMLSVNSVLHTGMGTMMGATGVSHVGGINHMTNGGGMMMVRHGSAAWLSWTGMALNAVVITGVILLGYVLLKRSGATDPEEYQVLRLRLAKGEITPDEFDALMKRLQA